MHARPRRPALLAPILGVGFIIAGLLHFLRPDPYVSIVPPWLPSAELLVGVSGVAEVLGGVGMLVPRTRRIASIGLITLLVAVLPANMQMALDPSGAGGDLPPALLWARLPLQPVLAWLVWRAARPHHREARVSIR